MGQLGLIFVLSIFLQDGRHLSAVDNGLWLVPNGIFIIIGSQVGGRLVRHLGPTTVVRIGLCLEVVGLTIVAFMVSPTVQFWQLLLGFLPFGIGIGFAVAQLTNVVLSDIAPERAGAASGANSTVRQIGAALGIAVVGTLLTTLTIRHAVHAMEAAGNIPPGLKTSVIAGVRDGGVSFDPAAGAAPGVAATIRSALESAVTAGAKPALFFAAIVVAIGTAVSFLIPRVEPLPADDELRIEVMEPDPAPV